MPKGGADEGRPWLAGWRGRQGTHSRALLPPSPFLCPSFFEDYKKNENKVVVVDEFLGVEHAKRIIEEAMSCYTDLFVPKRMR